jgi:hypothetical protein
LLDEIDYGMVRTENIFFCSVKSIRRLRGAQAAWVRSPVRPSISAEKVALFGAPVLGASSIKHCN